MTPLYEAYAEAVQVTENTIFSNESGVSCENIPCRQAANASGGRTTVDATNCLGEAQIGMNKNYINYTSNVAVESSNTVTVTSNGVGGALRVNDECYAIETVESGNTLLLE